jgi:hypothetical protein
MNKSTNKREQCFLFFELDFHSSRIIIHRICRLVSHDVSTIGNIDFLTSRLFFHSYCYNQHGIANIVYKTNRIEQ